MKKKNDNFVSYIITVFNKRKYLFSVIEALAKEGGSHKREYIFIEDGSNDGSFLILKALSHKLPGHVKIIRRRNMGASYSTNEAISYATGYWLRLLDGDDEISFKSTAKMLLLARKTKEEFVYGLIHAKTQVQIENNKINYELQSKEKGLNKFIRNCPANSSCILVSIKRFYQAGACNVSFVSPDQILFLRLFARGNGIFLNEIVASMPLKPSSIGLSSQIRRSRYESILALIKFCEENNNINSYFKKLAFRRALSRANTYNKFLNKNFFSVYLLMYLVSKFYFPNNYLNWMYLCLKVFTMEGIDKCFAWQTGYEKKMVYRSNFWKY